MTEPTFNQVCMYFDSYGWKYEIAADGRLVAAFAGEQSGMQFNLVVAVSEHWVGLTIWPYLMAIKEQQRGIIAGKLAMLNFYELKLARFALTSNGEVTLCLDLPVAALTESLFHVSLDMICFYADAHYAELVTLLANLVA